MNIMKQFIVSLLVLILIGCKGNTSSIDSISDSLAKMSGIGNYQGRHIFEFDSVTVPFFGKTLMMDDSSHIMRQIAEIAADDKMLSVDGKMLMVGEVGFGINFNKTSVNLISTTQIDDPRIMKVIEYLNDLYEAFPENGIEDTYLWSSKFDDPKIKKRKDILRGLCGEDDEIESEVYDWWNQEELYFEIKMRPLHDDEGGSVLIFYSSKL